MKSLKESLGLSKPLTVIDGMPKTAVGILPHQESEKLIRLWADIVKSEESFQKLTTESNRYCTAIKDIQSTEEKLVKLIGDSNVCVQSSEFQQIMDEYLSVVIETRNLSDETACQAAEFVSAAPAQYHSLYEPLETTRKKRDSLINEVERIQDKLDKFKLKGKRTTDLMVEKEKTIRQLKDVHCRLVAHGQQFHDIRVPLLKSCFDAQTHNQINYYGNMTGEFGKYIHISRGAHQTSDKNYDSEMDGHLNRIRALTIVDF